MTEQLSDNDKRWRLGIGIGAVLWGPFLMLEGFRVTGWGEIADGTPHWVVIVAGLAFFIVGCLSLVPNHHERYRNLLAAAFCALLGCIGVWVSLFSPEGSINNESMIPFLSWLPIGRIVFGAGALMCFGIAYYAIKLAAAPSTNNK